MNKTSNTANSNLSAQRIRMLFLSLTILEKTMKNTFIVFAFITLLIGCTITEENKSDSNGKGLISDIQKQMLTEMDRNYDKFLTAEGDSIRYLLWEEALADSNYHLMVEIKITQLTHYLMRGDFREAYEIVNEAIELSDKSGSARYKVLSRKWLADTKSEMGEKEQALEIINEAFEIFESELESDELKHVLLGTRGKIFSSLDRNYEALADYYEVIRIIEGDEEQRRNKAVLNNMIGLILNDQDEYEEALERFTIAYNINRELNSVHNLSTNLNNLALALAGMGKTEQAIDTLFAAIAFNTEYDLKHAAIQNKFNLAVNFIKKGDYINAIDIGREGLKLSEELNFPFGMLYHNSVISRAYFNNGNYDTALGHALDAYELSSLFGVRQIMSDVTELIYKIYADKGETEQALAYLEIHHELKLELKENVRSAQISELRAQYNMEQKEAEFQLLQQNLAIQESLNASQRQINAILFITMIIVTGFLLYTFKNQRRLRLLLSALEDQKNDIQKKNKALEKLNSDRDALIGVIVHDLKNPLSSISGLVEVMSMNELDEENRSLLSMIDISSKKMQRLVNNLLDIKKVERSDIQTEFKEISTREIVEDSMSAFRMMAARKLIIIQEDVDDFIVKTYPDYVSRIIDNLISNAIKFSNLGSKVSLTIKKATDNFWEIIVDDEGIGIPEKEKEKLFQMFSQISNKPTGGESSTGIGLYTVALLTSKLNGTIFLEDKKNQGSRFVCRLPFSTSNVNQKADKEYVRVPG